MKRIVKTLVFSLIFSLIAFYIAIASPVPNIGHTRSSTGYFVANASPIPDIGRMKSYTETFGEGADYSNNLYFYTKLDPQGGDIPATAFTAAESGSEAVVNIPTDYTHIQSAIDASRNGDVIIVHPGTYYENIDFLGKAITVKSTDPNDPNVVSSTIIDGSGSGRVVKFINREGPNCVLSGFTVKNGKAPYGGGIYCYRSSSPTITNCTISGNSVSSGGGGIYCDYYSSPNIVNCTISNNSASSGGGIHCYYSSSPTIVNCTISNNSASSGGGIYCYYSSSPTITNCTISNNSASSGGGIYCYYSSSPTITNCKISDNSASSGGGGIYCDHYSSPTIANCTISGNSALSGGSIYCYWSSSPTITNCTISDNSASSGGGGIYCDYYSSPTIANCTISGNSALYGGSIHCDYYSSPAVTNCTISWNSASYGGGIYCYYSSPAITNCTISDNSASPGGGGIYCDYYSSPPITNCTISSNSASSGGGIYCYRTSSPTITNCTITGNSASSGGGGIYCSSSSPTITNCIFWGDFPNEISGASGGAPKVSYSDIQQGTGFYPGKGNINSDPLFVGKDQGKYYLMPGSPCIDKGTSTNAPSGDKEGIQRPQGMGMDMGAYEYVEPTSCTPRASFTADKTKGTDSLTVEFDAASSGGSEYSGALFSWDFGDGTGATGVIVSHTYSGYGSYDVSLTVTTECGSHSLTLSDLIKIRSSQVTKEVGEGYTYTSIQKAIDEARYGDVILVHDGTYYDNINFKGKRITVISENGPAATIIDGGAKGSVVTFDHSEDKDSVLDGFTIQNGSETGIYCSSYTSPTIANCTISGNSASDDGGGIYCDYYSSPAITNCQISTNSASDDGGGIYCDYYSSPAITNCQISTNSASDDGGGIYCDYYSSPAITNCQISGNLASHGGGIYCGRSSSPALTNCTISGNLASSGGGIYCGWSSSPAITNCQISVNPASSGGGIYCYYYSSPAITNCTISGNLASSGGGIYCDWSSSTIITDSILWNDSPSEIRISNNSALTIMYSNIQGGYPGEGNISEDPLFIDANADDFHLSQYSPCIDKGDPNSLITEDKDGITRPRDGDTDGVAICDMGAYEYTALIYCYIDKDGDLYGDPDNSIQEYSCPTGYVTIPGDCHDNDNTIYPGATELHDGKDNDCNGSIDVDFGNLNFDDHSILSYAEVQDSDPDQYEILDGGATLHLWGNNWKTAKFPYPYEVKKNTIIEFDFLSDGEDAEMNGIGLDADAILSTDALFQICGTQTSSTANQDYNTYSGNEWMHFVIPVGEFYTGSRQYLFFSNDADAGQATSVYYKNVKIYEKNNPPQITSIEDQTIAEGDELSLIIQATDPDDGDNLVFSLDEAPSGTAINQDTGEFEWTPPDGEVVVSITVRVTDDGTPILSATETFIITVSNVAPELVISGAETVLEGELYTLSISASDPGTDTITEWGINWGDESIDTLPGSSIEATHTYPNPGTYTISATATDEDGTYDADTLTLTVEPKNNPPVAMDDATTTTEDTPVTITASSLLSNDEDPDTGDILTIESIDTTGTLGTVTDNGDGTFTYSPNGQFDNLTPDESATDSFTYTVTDGNGGTDTAKVTVTVEGT